MNNTIRSHFQPCIRPLLLLIALCSLTVAGCKKDKVTGEWTVPRDEVFDGGPGKDGIPSVDNPAFTDAGSAAYLDDSDLVLGFKVGNTVRAYPHPILDWHEIVNDRVDGVNIAVTYCPLTGTGIGWDREVNGNVTTFGVSGLLFESNLIPYDRETDSNWSQMLLESINGEHLGTQIDLHPMVETTWATWKAMYPNTEVMSSSTGFDRNYGQYPYGDYRTNHDNLLFPVSTTDDRLPAKERVHGVIVDGIAKVYGFSHFQNDTEVIRDNFNNQEMLVVGNETDNWIVSFGIPASDTATYSGLTGQYPAIMADNAGNEWDVFGHAISGPRTGEQLTATRSYIGYWFAWGTFYQDAEIHQ